MLHIANIIKDQHFFDGQIAYHDMTAEVCQHDYFILAWEKQLTFKYMDMIDRVKILTPDEFIDSLKTNNYDALFIHNFLYMPLQYMDKLPKEIKVFWFAWGWDIYCAPHNDEFIKMPLLHPKSKSVWREIIKQSKLDLCTEFKLRIKKMVKNIVRYDHVYHNEEPKVYRNAVKRVDYFAGVFPLEYNLVKKNPEFRAEQVYYEYTNPKDFCELPNALPTIGDNILVGNSADINNNHLDVLDYIKNLTLGERKVIVPISYGGSKNYAKIVADAYKAELGMNCQILVDYMPREEYFHLLSTCGIAIFFHERQQATCNVEELLKHGVKVFLSETSINYRHYKSIGMYVFSVQKDLSDEEIRKPLTDEQKWNNVKILHRTSNKEYRLQYLYNIYKLLEK